MPQQTAQQGGTAANGQRAGEEGGGLGVGSVQSYAIDETDKTPSQRYNR